MARTRKLPTKKPRKLSIKPKKVGLIGKTMRAIGRFIAKIFRPFRFVLRPFKTRPIKFIGRLLSKVLFINYFKQSWKELRQVTWPGRKETTQLTFAVFIFAITFSIVISIIDFGLDKLFREVLLR